MDRVIRRQDRIEADVECLMCGRLLGELFGLWWRDTSGRRTARSLAHLTTFRAAYPGAPSVPLNGRVRFRCPECGGSGIIGEVSTSVVGEALPPGQLCPVHTERRQRAGRPPRGCRCNELDMAA